MSLAPEFELLRSENLEPGCELPGGERCEDSEIEDSAKEPPPPRFFPLRELERRRSEAAAAGAGGTGGR